MATTRKASPPWFIKTAPNGGYSVVAPRIGDEFGATIADRAEAVKTRDGLNAAWKKEQAAKARKIAAAKKARGKK